MEKNIQENITFSLSNYPPLGEMSVFRALDVYKHPYSYFDCNWRDKKFSNISELKSNSKQDHKGKNYIYHYKRMRIEDDFFSEDIFSSKILCEILN